MNGARTANILVVSNEPTPDVGDFVSRGRAAATPNGEEVAGAPQIRGAAVAGQ
jgi:hypothetical protein